MEHSVGNTQNFQLQHSLKQYGLSFYVHPCYRNENENLNFRKKVI